jgi:hypothetical protein
MRMLDRRNALILGAGGALGSLVGGSDPALAAKGMTSAAALSPANFHHTGVKALAKSTRIAMPTYRFGVVMSSGIAATGASGSTRVEARAELAGVDLPMLRQIAHLAFSDFVDKIRATGRTVLGWNEISGAPGFAKLDQSQVPFLKKPFADARTVAMVTPEYLPLFNLHSDAPLSDKSPFSLGNLKALNALSAQLQCLVLIPSIVIDFASLTGSGHKVYGGSANVGINPGLFLVPLFTQLSFFHARIPMAGDGGKLILEDRISIGQAGKLVQAASYNNRAEIEEWNAYARSSYWWAQRGATPPLRPTGAYDYSTYQYRVDRAQFARACQDAAKTMNGIYVAAAATNRPG